MSDVSTSMQPVRKPFGLLFMIVLADMVGFGIMIPLLPFYARQFHASNIEVTLLLSVYAFCQFIAAPMLGSLSDKVGRRPVLIFSQIGSGLASVTLAVASIITFDNPTVGLIIIYASRIVDGFSGGNISAAQAYVSDITTPQQRAKYMGMLGAGFGIGFTLGPAIGGVLGHFHPAFPPLAAALFSFTAAGLCFLRLPETINVKGRANQDRYNEKTEKTPQRSSQLSRSIALMRQPILAQVNCIWFLSMFAFVTIEAILALYLADKFGFGKLGVGLAFTLAGVIIIIVQGKLIGPLTRLLGEWHLATIGPILFAVGMVIYTETVNHPLMWLLGIGILFNAFGRSMQTPAMSSIVSRQALADEQGAAFGLFHGMGSLARVGGPALAGLLYDRSAHLPFILAGILTVVAGLWMVLVRLQVRPADQSDTVGSPIQSIVETP
jgi:MFS transporter, DHA1 family, tetracycline resistance protein